MRNPTIEQLMELVLKDARTYDHRGPFVVEEQIKFYKLGMEGKIPPEWEKHIPKPTPEEEAMEAHPLQFEYCECGCKGHYGVSKGLGYWIYNDLASFYTKISSNKDKVPDNISTYRGHGPYGERLGVFHSFDEAVMAAQKDWNDKP